MGRPLPLIRKLFHKSSPIVRDLSRLRSGFERYERTFHHVVPVRDRDKMREA